MFKGLNFNQSKTFQDYCHIWNRLFLLSCFLFFMQPAFADFINGGFESTYTPDSTTCSPITGWTQTGYYFPGTGSSSPTSINDIGLLSSGGPTTPPVAFCGITDIVAGITQAID